MILGQILNKKSSIVLFKPPFRQIKSSIFQLFQLMNVHYLPIPNSFSANSFRMQFLSMMTFFWIFFVKQGSVRVNLAYYT